MIPRGPRRPPIRPMPRAAPDGPRCEKCADGYFGDPEGEHGPRRHCRPCTCNNNIDPRVAGNCDSVTGECLKCVHNTAGFYCDRCKEGHFGNPLNPNPELKCKACYCNPVGSQQPGCQEDGSCLCKEGFNGENCDQPECPDCYSQVSEKMNLYKRQLQDITVASNGQSQAPDTRFLEEQMRRAEETSRGMLRDAETSHGVELSLQRQMSGLQGLHTEIQSDLGQAQAKLRAAESQSGQYQNQLQDTKRKIALARQQLVEGQADMNRLTFPSANLPSGALSQLSQEAQTIANRLAQEAQNVAQDAADALEDTQRALQILRSGDTDLTAAERLRTRLYDVRTQVGAVEAEAIQAAAAAERSHQNSMQTARLLAEASAMDPVGLQGEMDRLSAESSSLRTSVEAELSQSKNLQSKFTAWEQEAEQQLQEGQQYRVLADQLLSRTNAAKRKAEQAMLTGNSTYYEIEGISASLKGFGDQVGDRRREAEEAMRRLPQIQRMTQAASDTTDRAVEALKGAEKDANMAAANAGEAQSISSAIQQDMLQMGQDVNSSAELALTLEREFAALRKMAAGADGALNDRTKAAERDSAAAQEMAESALEAQASASSTLDAVAGTLRALDNVLSLLDQPMEGNNEGLRALEKSMQSARTEVTGRLRPALEELELAAKLQKQRILSLDQGIQQTLIDIQNLRDIRDTLPPGCYSTTAIERP